MWHEKRKWCLKTISSPEALATALTEMTWCLCTAFSVEGHPDYLFLNDATHEDGAGEWAVVKRTPEGFIQVESVTFSWCDGEKTLEYIQTALSGAWDQGFAMAVTAVIQLPAEHGKCSHCA